MHATTFDAIAKLQNEIDDNTATLFAAAVAKRATVSYAVGKIRYHLSRNDADTALDVLQSFVRPLPTFRDDGAVCTVKTLAGKLTREELRELAGYDYNDASKAVCIDALDLIADYYDEAARCEYAEMAA